VQVYFGRGKGKTTAALGQGFRATGHGFKVYMIQFMKGYPQYGEVKAIENTPNFDLKQFGTPDLIATPGEIDFEEGRKGMVFADKIIMSDEYDIVILDEIDENDQTLLFLKRHQSSNRDRTLTRYSELRYGN